MISYGWDDEDLQELILDLDRLKPEELLEDGEFIKFGKTVMNYVKEYPGPKPGSKYIRTRRLFRSWGMKVIDPLEVMIFNTAMDPDSEEFYANPVSGINQREMHKQTGWRNIYTSATSWFKVFADRLNKRAGRIWTTNGS